VPLSIFKLSRINEQAIVDRIAARIPLWKGNLLNCAGRTALVRATLSAVPMHTAIALPLSSWAIDHNDKLRSSFIWGGGQTVAAGKCKVAWEVSCRPRELGGLGITDLRRAGVALRVCWQWQRRVGGHQAWRLLLDDSEPAVKAIFQAATTFSLGDGTSTIFWTDRWLQGSCIKDLAPYVFAAVPKRKLITSVADALCGNAWVRHITGPRTMRLINEFWQLWELIQQVHLTPGSPDTFVWRLSTDGLYSAASAYGAMFAGSSRPLGAKLIWKTPPLECGFSFGWSCTGAAGLRNAASVMACRTRIHVSSVIRLLNRWTTSYSDACSPGKSGPPVYVGYTC
jgi:hypothetical protein